MNGIEKITQRIFDDAQTEIDEVLGRANAEASAIRSRYEAEAQREYDELCRRGAERAKEREENLAGAAQLEARKDTLTAKQSMLDRAFALAAEKLSALSDTDYRALLADLATRSSFTGKESIVLSAEDAQKHGAAVLEAANAKLAAMGKPSSLSLSSAHRSIGGGLLLSDGLIETNCSFETLLRLVRTELSGEVAKTLFD